MKIELNVRATAVKVQLQDPALLVVMVAACLAHQDLLVHLVDQVCPASPEFLECLECQECHHPAFAIAQNLRHASSALQVHQDLPDNLDLQVNLAAPDNLVKIQNLVNQAHQVLKDLLVRPAALVTMAHLENQAKMHR
jgi:hypothetical protein